MADPFQTRCLQLRAEIGRWRRRTDRHLRDSMGPARLVQSMRSMVDQGARRWTPTMLMLSRLLGPDTHGEDTDPERFEQLAKLLRTVVIWLRRLVRGWQRVRHDVFANGSPATAEDGVDE